MFRFVQWELPGPIGPATGRYVLRTRPGGSPEQVLAIAAPASARSRARRPGGRRARTAAPEPEAAAPPVTRATVIEAAAFTEEADAAAWLERAAGEDAEATVAAALRLLNLAVHFHRLAAADPYVGSIHAGQALVTRVGYGSGEEVAEGRWTQARELPGGEGTRRARREAVLRPQERLAALLGGRDAPLACEELALRARLDLDQGREREAALQVHVALEAARVELAAWSGRSDMAARLAELGGLVEPVAAVAQAALAGGLPAGAADTVVRALDRVEAALRARAATGAY